MTTVFDLMLAQYGVARPGLPGAWPAGYDDAATAVHAGLAGADHRRAGGGRAPGSAREFADNAERSGGRSMILMGAGHQPLVPLRHDLPGDAGADDADRLPGRQRRRLGALRRAGEVPPGHRLGAAGVRAGLVAPAAADDRHRVLVPAHRPVALRPVRRRTRSPRPRRRATFAGQHTADLLAKSARLGWMPSMPTFDRNPLDLADEALAANPDDPAAHVAEALRRRAARVRLHRPGRAAELAAGADRVAGQPARLRRRRATSTSCATCSAPTPRCAPPRRRPSKRPTRRASGATRRRRASSTCCCRWTSG